MEKTFTIKKKNGKKAKSSELKSQREENRNNR